MLGIQPPFHPWDGHLYQRLKTFQTLRHMLKGSSKRKFIRLARYKFSISSSVAYRAKDHSAHQNDP